MQFTEFLGAAGALALVASFATPADAQTPLTTVRIASGLSNPLYATASPIPGDQRLFVVEQSQADIEIVVGTVKNAVPFLNLDNSVPVVAGGEQGLLGFAFHPDYASNGHIFVYYTTTGGASQLDRFTVSATDPDRINPNTRVSLLNFSQPFTNHNGGMIAFGPDGYLYVGTGDGGSGNDPSCNAQNPGAWLGKMLRLDIDTIDATGGYGIPADNPFVGDSAYRPEIYHLGLRNPWRYSFDRATGDMYIGDVGQNAQEEVSFGPAGVGGINFGWRIQEGNLCNGIGSCPVQVPGCGSSSFSFPIHTYNHAGAFGGPCSISGGYVYRGCAIPDLQGTYFFADYCSNEIWSLEFDGTTVTNFTDRTAELDPAGALAITSIVSFGEGPNGELLIVDQGGEVFQVVPNGVPAVDCPPLVSTWGGISVGSGGSTDFLLDAGAGQAGAIYLVLGSASGTAPGITLDGNLLPLNPDAYSTLTLTAPNLPPFTNTFSLLDGSGTAVASLDIPGGALGVAAVGLTFNHAYLTLGGGGTVAFTSNAVSLTLAP
ncbi:PQQ-dependent sugar dehydrogenase [Engelhardtia mirabilis]|uniref:Soluble aldose sugar dehydrogenase YliI n=1 Tax=Engelhardtia mirabilis TaxID=2528011 RepID=A0A518BLI8_9BACT|nr:Soluble aldose sugar dehydrogenase YliI precursor [Planctomycetes bacterium Pla133]QDV02163.1 Soluble aldose sugar dehydrogenase YliI precursor [Planctomycetes bacterium Pla86]